MGGNFLGGNFLGDNFLGGNFLDTWLPIFDYNALFLKTRRKTCCFIYFLTSHIKLMFDTSNFKLDFRLSNQGSVKY